LTICTQIFAFEDFWNENFLLSFLASLGLTML